MFQPISNVPRFLSFFSNGLVSAQDSCQMKLLGWVSFSFKFHNSLIQAIPCFNLHWLFPRSKSKHPSVRVERVSSFLYRCYSISDQLLYLPLDMTIEDHSLYMRNGYFYNQTMGGFTYDSFDKQKTKSALFSGQVKRICFGLICGLVRRVVQLLHRKPNEKRIRKLPDLYNAS